MGASAGLRNVTPFIAGSVRGFLHEPLQATGDGLVLTHGAGANCQSALLTAVATAFCSAGFLVLRCDLPFRQRRPSGPPFPKTAAEDRAGLRDAIAAMRGLRSAKVFLGGHSYGGRQASILAAEDPTCADALLLLSYPLHPPRKPQDLRTAHFPALRVPPMFIHGTRDPFGSIDEMRAAIELIPARNKLIPVESAGHDLARGKFDIDRLVVEQFRSFTAA